MHPTASETRYTARGLATSRALSRTISGCRTSIQPAAETKSRMSAIASNCAPRGESWRSRRARRPSRTSVAAAATSPRPTQYPWPTTACQHRMGSSAIRRPVRRSATVQAADIDGPGGEICLVAKAPIVHASGRVAASLDLARPQHHTADCLYRADSGYDKLCSDYYRCGPTASEVGTKPEHHNAGKYGGFNESGQDD